MQSLELVTQHQIHGSPSSSALPETGFYWKGTGSAELPKFNLRTREWEDWTAGTRLALRRTPQKTLL